MIWQLKSAIRSFLGISSTREMDEAIAKAVYAEWDARRVERADLWSDVRYAKTKVGQIWDIVAMQALWIADHDFKELEEKKNGGSSLGH